MRRVVYKRLRALKLAPEDVITEEALNNLIAKSGGVMRELVSLMRDACVKARLMGRAMIDEEIAEKAIYSSRRKYAAGLSEPYFEELKKVLELERPTGSEICDRLLQNLYVLGYSNYDLWFDVHPNQGLCTLFMAGDKPTTISRSIISVSHNILCLNSLIGLYRLKRALYQSRILSNRSIWGIMGLSQLQEEPHGALYRPAGQTSSGSGTAPPAP